MEKEKEELLEKNRELSERLKCSDAQVRHLNVVATLILPNLDKRNKQLVQQNDIIYTKVLCINIRGVFDKILHL